MQTTSRTIVGLVPASSQGMHKSKNKHNVQSFDKTNNWGLWQQETSELEKHNINNIEINKILNIWQAQILNCSQKQNKSAISATS